MSDGMSPTWDDIHGWHGDNLTLGMQVRNARGLLSGRELARRVGISPSYLVDIEADRRRPSAKVWNAIAAAIPVDRDAVIIERARMLARRDPELFRYIVSLAESRYVIKGVRS
jgi:transcriptional regulator with XRE-family HTH domain